MEKKKIWKDERVQAGVLVLAAFLLLTAWAFMQPLGAGPDEKMRYMVAQYLHEHPGKLPLGDEPTIRDATWGISYAYYPILSYMVSAVFMGIAGLFHASADGLLHAARMADVLFVTGAVYFVVKASGKLFPKKGRWLFAALAGFMPQALFLGTYVNTDSLALLSMAMILYSWSCYLEAGDWSFRNSILLAVGMAVCALSYYNAYGWILCSFLFFCLTVLLCREEPVKQRVAFLFRRGIVIAAVTFALCGWWFIRNAVLYDGDLIGRKACAQCAEKYAAVDYRPSRYPTPEKLNWSWKDILLYQDPGWQHNWLLTVLVSFIGTFGLMQIYMPYSVSKAYFLFFGMGGIGILTMLGMFYPKKRTVVKERKAAGSEKLKIKTITVYDKWDRKGIFHLLLILLILIPVGLFMYYVYYSDNQAQGRYIMPALYPAMYFVTAGWNRLLERFVKKENIRMWIYRVLTALLAASPFLCYIFLVVPFYG